MTYLHYDPLTGTITDDNNLFIFTASLTLGIRPVDIKKNSTTSIDDMIKLKNSGFTADEVIAIKKANL